MTDVSSLDLPDNWKLNPLFLNVEVLFNMEFSFESTSNLLGPQYQM